MKRNLILGILIVLSEETHKKNTEKMHEAHALSVAGKSLSMVSTSWLRRLIIRPIGVTSKKAGIGARITLCSKSLCKKRAAPNAPRNKDNVARNTVNTIRTKWEKTKNVYVMIMNMPMQNNFMLTLTTTKLKNQRRIPFF